MDMDMEMEMDMETETETEMRHCASEECKEVLIGLDIGTQSSKAILYHPQTHKIVARCSSLYDIDFDDPAGEDNNNSSSESWVNKNNKNIDNDNGNDNDDNDDKSNNDNDDNDNDNDGRKQKPIGRAEQNPLKMAERHTRTPDQNFQYNPV